MNTSVKKEENKMSTELSLVEIKNPLQVFSTLKGLDAIIDKIEAEVKSVDRDISTVQGRENIRSMAFKIAKSKNALDKMGKELTEEQRIQINAVNAERKRAWDRMESLQEEIRKPLTDWENAEKNRVEKHEADIAEIINGGKFTLENWQTLSPESMNDRLKEIEALVTWTWQEFETRAKQAIEESTKSIRVAIEKRRIYEEERAELERLRKEEAERKQREHEERLKAEAAAKAKAEAEAHAKREAEEAAKRERDKIEAERKAEADATVKREADKKHRAKINNEALEGLLTVLAGDNLLTAEATAKAVVTAIANKMIPHIKIEY